MKKEQCRMLERFVPTHDDLFFFFPLCQLSLCAFINYFRNIFQNMLQLFFYKNIKNKKFFYTCCLHLTEARSFNMMKQCSSAISNDQFAAETLNMKSQLDTHSCAAISKANFVTSDFTQRPHSKYIPTYQVCDLPETACFSMSYAQSQFVLCASQRPSFSCGKSPVFLPTRSFCDRSSSQLPPSCFPSSPSYALYLSIFFISSQQMFA